MIKLNSSWLETQGDQRATVEDAMIVGKVLAVGQTHGPQSGSHCSATGGQDGTVEQDHGVGEGWQGEYSGENRKQLYNLLGWAWHESSCVDRGLDTHYHTTGPERQPIPSSKMAKVQIRRIHQVQAYSV
jgi:hypothetical protein